MSQTKDAKIMADISMRDGIPTIVVNGTGRSFAADKLAAAKIVKAAINTKGFPHPKSISNSK